MVVDRRTERYLHDYVRSWIDWLHLGERCFDTTHDSLKMTQDRHNMCVDRDKVEHKVEIGDVVYLTVKPFRPSVWRRGGTERMRPQLFGPFRVIQRAGEVVYELELTAKYPRSMYLPCIMPPKGVETTGHYSHCVTTTR
jgi:hypothetical protein